MTELDIKVIRKISELELLDNVQVDSCITEMGDRKDVDDEIYIIDIHSTEYISNAITYIKFSISVNPINGDEPIDLVDEVEKKIRGFKLSQICIVENLEDYNQLVEDGCGTEDWGAISYVYEVYSREF